MGRGVEAGETRAALAAPTENHKMATLTTLYYY